MKTLPLSFALLSVSLPLVGAMVPETNRLTQLTLEQAWELAERLHPDVAEARALIDAAEGRVKQAGTLPNPEAIARMESAPFNGRTTSEAEYLAGLVQPVPLGKRLSKARQAEQFERARRVKELEVRRNGLRKRVHSAFATALYQERAFLAQSNLVSDAAKLAAAAKARVEAGDVVREELARAEMELARARVEQRRTEAMRQQAITALTAAIGDPALSLQSLSGSLDAAFEIPTLETLSAGLAVHPAIALADADSRARSVRVDLAKAERIPDVRVELLYRRLEAEKQNAFDVGASIPLPLFDRSQGKLREARAEAVAAEARSLSTQNELILRLNEAHAQLTAALANSRSLKTEILPRAETVLKAAEARYAAGDVSLSEVLPIRRDWAAVQLTYLESLHDIMQAWVALTPYMKRN